MNDYPYALYLDNKIIGAANQLVSFFTNGVFSTDNTIIYLKKYKESHKQYSQIFQQFGIVYRFMKPSDLDALENQVIFYAFNAQSNCRLVANRKLKHIFITHGESNKIASIKPIIRIYDHVVMAGELSLERYYKSGLFDEHDYQTGRLIMMGDTFIGKVGFSVDQSNINVVCYAPTWEGGNSLENYSSLGFPHASSLIKSTMNKCGIRVLLIKLHPNTGHRDKNYFIHVYNLGRFFSNIGFQVKIYFDQNKLPWWIRIKLYLSGVRFISSINQYYPRLAYSDISAMETQFLSENIPYQVFYRAEHLQKYIPDKFHEFYLSHGVCLDKPLTKLCNDGNCSQLELMVKEKVIAFTDSTIKKYNYRERLKWLVNKIK